MNEGLIVGFDLCKDFCRLSYYLEGADEPIDVVFSEQENPYPVQNSICKKKGDDSWLIGEDAYEMALLGGGAIVDKLLRLVAINGHSTFEGVRYSAEDLLYHFIDEALKVLYLKEKTSEVAQIMFTVQDLNRTVLDAIIRCARKLGFDRKKIHIISHEEAYLYYVLSQKPELWSNLSVLYDLSGDGLNYYEMEILRGMQPNVAKAGRSFLEEGFSPDILSDSHGRRMADNIMTGCVNRMLTHKSVSACYLSGIGMESCQVWGNHFLKTLCQRRRVFYIENLFAKGAVYAAREYEREKSVYPFRMMCEGRINVEISADVYQGMNQRSLHLSEIGDNWYETKAEFDFIPDRENSLKLKIHKLGERQNVLLEIPLDRFDLTPNKCRRINVRLRFTAENSFSVTLRDKGFGEFFPATDTMIENVYTIE